MANVLLWKAAMIAMMRTVGFVKIHRFSLVSCYCLVIYVKYIPLQDYCDDGRMNG